MNIQEKIQAILSVEVAEVREWAFVYWVRPRSGRPTLVSKKAVATELVAIAPLRLTLKASGRRGSPTPWVARIDGTDPKYSLNRAFVEPTQVRWNSRGCDEADFLVQDLGYFQDSNNGYWQAVVEGGAIVRREVSAAEVKFEMKRRSELRPVIA